MYPTSSRRFSSIIIIPFVFFLAVSILCRTAAANDPPQQAWSRSLPSRTVKGFPVFVQHAVLAQDADSGLLYAFAVNDGSVLWNTSFTDCGLHQDQFASLFPHVVDTGAQDPNGRHIITVQSETTVIALDLWSGSCIWANTEVFHGPAPAYRAILSSDGQFVIVAAPKIPNSNFLSLGKKAHHLTKEKEEVGDDPSAIHVTGLDVHTGTPQWQHQADELCNWFPSGSPLPVVVTERTFFGCFVNPNYVSMKKEQELRKLKQSHAVNNHNNKKSAMSSLLNTPHSAAGPPAPSIVKEVQLNDNAFHCRIFDFSPRTILMTPTFQFFTGSQPQAPQPQPQPQPPVLQQHPGEADRVAFAISMFNPTTNEFYGPSSIVSVIAQAGVVDWQRFLPGQSIQFAGVRPNDAKDIVVTDGTTYIVTLNSKNGNPIWNQTVSAHFANNNDQLALKPIDGFVIGKQNVAVTQSCTPPQEGDKTQEGGEDKMVPTPPVKVLTVYALDGEHAGTVRSQTGLSSWDSRSAMPSLIAFRNYVYFSTDVDVSTLNVETGEVARLAPTGAPAGSLRLDELDNRALFGTEYSIFCVQTK